MSYSQSVKQVVDNVVIEYIHEISKKYNIQKGELLSLWNDNNECVNIDILKEKEVEVKVVKKEVDTIQYQKCTVAELKGFLKEKGLKCSGTKPELLIRLVNGKNEALKTTAAPKKVTKQLTSNISSLQIRRNAHGNYEHVESRLVFNTDRKVVGMQLEDGSVADMTKEYIDLCNKYKFEYFIPENLDKGVGLENTVIDEFEDDEEEVEEELEIIEELVDSDNVYTDEEVIYEEVEVEEDYEDLD
jgi:hypothetical protein